MRVRRTEEEPNSFLGRKGKGKSGVIKWEKERGRKNMSDRERPRAEKRSKMTTAPSVVEDARKGAGGKDTRKKSRCPQQRGEL